MTDVRSTLPAHPRLEHLAHDLERFRAFVRVRMADPQQVEEILQDAFARAAKAIDQLRDAERLDAWFYRILRNRIADHRDHHPGHAGVGAELPAPTPETAEICACLLPLIQRLPPDHAEALRRVDLAGEDPAYVAAASGISVNLLTVRRHRARQQLRTLLEEACGRCATEGCQDCSCEPRP